MKVPEDRRLDKVDDRGAVTTTWPARAQGVGPSRPRRLRPFDLRHAPFSSTKSRAAAVVNTSLGGFRSSSRHPAGEGNHHQTDA